MPKENGLRTDLINRCFVKRSDGQLLIIKRNTLEKVNAGKWEIPSIKLLMGQDLTEPKGRAALEEVALFVRAIQPLALLDTFTIGSGPTKGQTCIVIFSIDSPMSGKVRLTDTHVESRWVPYDGMLACDLTREVRAAAIALKHHLR